MGHILCHTTYEFNLMHLAIYLLNAICFAPLYDIDIVGEHIYLEKLTMQVVICYLEIEVNHPPDPH